MKAVVLHEYGPASNLKYEEFADPKPGPGEVLVRVHGAGVNPIDWKIRSGAHKDQMPFPLPMILGFDFAGVVQELGEGVTNFEPGDRVFGRTMACYAELTVARAEELIRIPHGLESTTAAALGVVVTTGNELIHEAIHAQAGQTILLTAALGSVGRIALYAAREAGVNVIAGVRKRQIDEALMLGATAAIDLSDDEEIAKLGLLDAVADGIGGALAAKLLAKVKPGGYFGSIVGPPEGAALHPTVTVNAFSSHPDPAACLHFAEAIRDGKLKLPIDRLMPLAEAAEAQTIAEKGGVGKIVLTA
jgi:NADPH:quinone reductase-like Zn-dependent oxidoreductase